MGLYFLSPPSGVRGARIVYDRLDSAFATTPASAWWWPTLLKGISWLHLSGIIPAIGPGMAEVSLAAIAAAREAGVRVSFDGNYRASMWDRWCDDAQPILADHVDGAELLLGNHRDISLLLGETYDGDTVDARRAACQAAFRRFPRLATIASTTRTIVSSDCFRLSARIDRRDEWFETREIVVDGVIDRIGTGDAFAAGVLAGIDGALEIAAHRALALGALKHGTLGDHSRTTMAELKEFTFDVADVRR